MNFYSHHIGDFNNATRHLTRVERALYRDLIELYYDTEQPLITGFESLARRVLARDDEEKSALKLILDEFFTLESDGYHNKRCDAEIAKYRANIESKAKAGRASAAVRQQNSTPVDHVLNECATNQEPLTINQEQSKALVNDDAVDPLPAKKDCPHESIIALYHETLPALPRVAVWDERRKTFLRSRWREDPERQSLDWWRRWFGYIGKSDFLMGRVDSKDRKPFQANLEWMLRPSNFVKIIEGNYEP